MNIQRRCIKLFSNKRALELSINFLVMVIIAIVIFGFGIRFAYQMFAQGNELTEDAYKKYSKQIDDLACATAEKACLPTKTITLQDGPAIFGLVIENVLPRQETFSVHVEPGTFVAKGSSTRSAMDLNNIQYMPGAGPDAKQVALAPNEKTNVGIVVQSTGAAKGTYSFTVTVLKQDASPYANPFKIYVKV